MLWFILFRQTKKATLIAHNQKLWNYSKNVNHAHNSKLTHYSQVSHYHYNKGYQSK